MGHCTQYWGYNVDQNQHCPCFLQAYSLGRRNGNQISSTNTLYSISLLSHWPFTFQLSVTKPLYPNSSDISLRRSHQRNFHWLINPGTCYHSSSQLPSPRPVHQPSPTKMYSTPNLWGLPTLLIYPGPPSTDYSSRLSLKGAALQGFVLGHFPLSFCVLTEWLHAPAPQFSHSPLQTTLKYESLAQTSLLSSRFMSHHLLDICPQMSPI